MDCERLMEDDSPVRAAEAAGAVIPLPVPEERLALQPWIEIDEQPTPV